MTCNSRENEFFVGWNEDLEPPIGRPISSWEDVEPRAGRPTAEESKMTSDAARASVWESGSSVTGSPRGETQKKHAAQIRTYQDVDSETNLGSLKKLTGEPLWLVHRKDVTGPWCLLCGKNGNLEHLGGGQHRKKLDWVDGTLDSWNYVFIDWLRDNPTMATTASPAKDNIRTPETGTLTSRAVGGDETFTLTDVGLLKILPKEPCWIVQRIDTGDKWCLLCGKVADTWGEHQGSGKHKKKEANAADWMEYMNLGFLMKEGSPGKQETPPQKTVTSSSSSSSATPGAQIPWAGKVGYHKEERQARDLGDSEPIYRISSRTARIRIDRDDILVNAVWLVAGRPGYMVFKEDGLGQKEDWREPFCLACGLYGTGDHMDSPKHTDKVSQATYQVDAKGYEEVIQWLVKDAEDVIHVSNASLFPTKQRPISEAGTSDEESDAGRPLHGSVPPSRKWTRWAGWCQ
jgi:hypothetical protein